MLPGAREKSTSQVCGCCSAAAELGCIGELEGEPVALLNLMLDLLEQLVERLLKAGPVKCKPTAVFAKAKTVYHWQ